MLTPTTKNGDAQEAVETVSVRASIDSRLAPESEARHYQDAGRPGTWERVVQVFGMAVGAGVVLLVMGALVVWVRLNTAGLPAEAGLAATPSAALVVTGAHVLLFPLLLSVVGVLYGNHQAKEAARRGTANTKAARVMWWFNTGLIFVGVSIALPVSWEWGTFLVAFGAALIWAKHVVKQGAEVRWTERQLMTRLSAGFAIATIAVALAGQLDTPSQLPPATVTLRDGHQLSGLLVATDAQTVYLGASHELKEVARSDVTVVVVGHPRASRPFNSSLVGRLLRALS